MHSHSHRVGIRTCSDYSPFGVELDGRTMSGGYKYGFQNQELDDEIMGEGNSVNFKFRLYQPLISRFFLSDLLAYKAPGWSPNRFCFNNPIQFLELDGLWEWEANGNLKAEAKDNSYTMAKFLGTSQTNAMQILNRCGVYADSEGILNLKEGQSLAKNKLFVETKPNGGITVSDSEEALNHYFSGNGQPADVGNQSAKELLNSHKFKVKHAKITSKQVESEGFFSIDMTGLTFHIGNTNVDYKITNNGKSSAVTYTFFARDGFWDPDFIDENTLGKIPIINEWTNTRPDGLGPNLERFGGTPYRYKTRERTYFFKPVEKSKQK